MGYDFTTQLLMSEMKKSNATMHAANSNYASSEIEKSRTGKSNQNATNKKISKLIIHDLHAALLQGNGLQMTNCVWYDQ